MRTVGIDPGYERLGVAVIDKEPGGRETVIYSGCIRTPAGIPMPDRLRMIGDRLSEILEKYRPDAAAIEDLYFAKNTTTAMSVAEARGVIQYVIARSGVPCFSYHPNAIKIAVTGYGGAKKTDIAFMVPKLVDYDASSRLDDEIDAVAVALTHVAHSRSAYPQKAL